MNALKKIVAMIILAIQMGVMELAFIHFNDSAKYGGGVILTAWQGLFLISVIGTFIWLGFAIIVGNGK